MKDRVADVEEIEVDICLKSIKDDEVEAAPNVFNIDAGSSSFLDRTIERIQEVEHEPCRISIIMKLSRRN